MPILGFRKTWSIDQGLILEQGQRGRGGGGRGDDGNRKHARRRKRSTLNVHENAQIPQKRTAERTGSARNCCTIEPGN